MATVDFFIDCWERTYREVFTPGFVSSRAERHLYPFRHIVVTVNNVESKADVQQLAEAALARGEIDRVVFVSDALPVALEICGLTEESLGKVFYFTNFFLVTVTCTDSDYIVHSAPEVELERAFDWITPAVAKLEANERYIAANPFWIVQRWYGRVTAAKGAVAKDDQYIVSQNFSDQCFLAKRHIFAQPIYNYEHPLSKRYPMSHIGRIFEMRIDSFMRCQNYWMLSDPRVIYVHQSNFGSEGASHLRTPSWRFVLGRLDRHYSGWVYNLSRKLRQLKG